MREEDRLQSALCRLLALYETQGRLMYYSVPNAARRSKASAAHLKRTGMRAGVPDICLLFPRGRIVFVEVKTPKGRHSPSQREWQERANGLGHTVLTARSVDDIHDIVKAMEAGT